MGDVGACQPGSSEQRNEDGIRKSIRKTYGAKIGERAFQLVTTSYLFKLHVRHSRPGFQEYPHFSVGVDLVQVGLNFAFPHRPRVLVSQR